ncbi:MAG: tRNA (guanosine(46)-N7)-methyltransferase TrmB [Acidobacteriota bacterium]|nr:tRNA (guanosine(46)-N7)-methyltransferase TrmB [Acidobacteriota bacterium]
MRIRVRDHVNPFSPRLLKPPAPLDFKKIFRNPNLPLHLDLGCALGGFVFKMARLVPEINFLGVDIREPMIERANLLTENADLGNLHYEFCNATISIESLFQNMPADGLQFVTIQFPDPHLKKRLAKRRMVKPQMVAALARFCAENAKIFIQSDVEEAAADICETFEQNPNFQRGHAEKWLAGNPFPVKTERETIVEARGLPVFRAMFLRNTVK